LAGRVGASAGVDRAPLPGSALDATPMHLRASQPAGALALRGDLGSSHFSTQSFAFGADVPQQHNWLDAQEITRRKLGVGTSTFL